MAIKFGRPIERMRPSPVEAEEPPGRLDLAIRPRRNRRAEWARRMVREHVLTTDDLIWPLFLVEGTKVRAPVSSMPDVERLSVDEAVRTAARAAKLTIPCLTLCHSDQSPAAPPAAVLSCCSFTLVASWRKEGTFGGPT